MLHLKKATFFCLILIISFGFISVKAQEFTSEQIADSLDYFPLDVGNEFYYASIDKRSSSLSQASWFVQEIELLPNQKFYSSIYQPAADWVWISQMRADSTTGTLYFYKNDDSYTGLFSTANTPYWDETYSDSTEVPIENFMVSSVDNEPIFEHSARVHIKESTPDSYSDVKAYYEGTIQKTDRDLLFDNPMDTLIKIKQFRVEMNRKDSSADSIVYHYAYAHRIGLLYFKQTEFYANSDFQNFKVSEIELHKAIVRGKEYTRSVYPFYTSIENTSIKPKSIEISAYPNPFNPQTTIRLSLAKSEFIRLSVFDVLGREIKLLFDGMLSSGSHSYAFDAGGFPSGMYVYRVEAEGFQQTGKLLLIK